MRSSVSVIPILLLATVGVAREPSRQIEKTITPRSPLADAVSLPQEAGQPSGPIGTAGVGATSRYDQVGLATWYGEELSGNLTASGAPFRPAAITAAHRTLPLGSHVEVTALDTGRTILVLINDRGPTPSDRLIDLSRGAAALLGTGTNSKAPVRVRAVTASPEDAAALSAGRAASSRLPAPPVLLTALRHQLIGPTAIPTPPLRQATTAIAPMPSQTPKPRATREVGANAAKPVREGRYLVQVAALSIETRARALAKRLGGRVDGGGGLWRVRLGPFVDAVAARRARDGAARQGYGDAAIITQ